MDLGFKGEIIGILQKLSPETSAHQLVDLNRQPMLSSAAMVSASSSSGSSKRPRPPSNGCQTASCLVDGCVSDLSKCREYHRRHKVCEAHSKTAIVMVGGREQRFCQQCSRFHSLVEFDEVKRSCRKRLDGHNKRRRKPQPDSLISGSFTNHQGHMFTSYGQVFPASTPKSSWPAIIKNEEDPPLYASCLPLHVIDSHFPVSSRGSYKEAKRFPFLQEDVEGLSSLPLLKTTANSKVAPPSSSSSSKLFDSDCALSLLSSSAVHVSGVDLAASSGDRIPVGQPLVPGMHHHYVGGIGQYSGSQASSFPITAISCSSMEEEQIGNMLASDGTDVDFNSDGLFHVGLEGSSSRGNSHTLPFTWQ